MSGKPPSVRDLIVNRLITEARQLKALAEMVRDGDIKSPKDLDENYLPYRMKALERITTVFPKSNTTVNCEEKFSARTE